MKTFKSLEHLKKRLEKSLCWEDWIKVNGKVYKLVEYGDKYSGGNYVIFQNKPTTDIIYITYQVPCFNKGEQTRWYKFYDLDNYIEGSLYRY